jgi:hypothetical protein
VGDAYSIVAIDDPATRKPFNGSDTVLHFNTWYLNNYDNSLTLTFLTVPSDLRPSEPLIFTAAGVNPQLYPLIFFNEGEYVGFGWAFPFTYSGQNYRLVSFEDVAPDQMFQIVTNPGTGSQQYVMKGTIQPANTPEPVTMLLLGSGLVGLGVFGRRLRKR